MAPSDQKQEQLSHKEPDFGGAKEAMTDMEVKAEEVDRPRGKPASGDREMVMGNSPSQGPANRAVNKALDKIFGSDN